MNTRREQSATVEVPDHSNDLDVGGCVGPVAGSEMMADRAAIPPKSSLEAHADCSSFFSLARSRPPGAAQLFITGLGTDGHVTQDSPRFLEGVAFPTFFIHNRGMALIVFLRGVNVGGHRTFRPSILARELSEYDVVNVGAAGTFVVRKPGSRAQFRTALLRKLPFGAEVLLCDGRDLIRLETVNPFVPEALPPDVVRFVSILSKAGGVQASLPVTFPSDGDWLVRVIASKGQFVFGMYRRHMKTIKYLGQIDRLYGVPATTRNWNTITAIVRILKGEVSKGRPSECLHPC